MTDPEKIITELQERIGKLTLELNQAQERLKESDKELGRFAYSVSHDLRAPLRAIDGFSKILREDFHDQLNDEGKRILGIIAESAEKMGQWMDALLTLSRLGRKEFELSEISMKPLVKTAWDGLKSEVADRAIQMNIKDLPDCYGDPSLILQVFSNLLANAIKFTQPKNLPIIEVGGYSEKNRVVFYVKDNGVGFDMKYVEKLFGVFQRLHREEEFKGNGVGLAEVTQIVRRHGGKVWAEGIVNEGACFYFALPIFTPEEGKIDG